ncbi:MAG: hypothetical protein QM680_07165 [Luteolibacter sp.]
MAIRWRENGKWQRTTRKSEADAKKWAQTKARELDAATGAQWITPASKEHLDWLRRLAGTSEVPQLLSRIETALASLKGESQALPDAAKWYAMQGEGGIVSISCRESKEGCKV